MPSNLNVIYLKPIAILKGGTLYELGAWAKLRMRVCMSRDDSFNLSASSCVHAVHVSSKLIA